MKSIMSHDFATTPQIDAPRSVFDMSYGHKTTFNSMWLIPVFHMEVLPGDTLNVNATMFARQSTQLYPPMDNMFLDSQFFFVPYRLLWSNWRKFCGEQVDPGDSIDYTIPKLEGVLTSDPETDLSDQSKRTQALMNYIGVPDTIAPDNVDISALPFRAYSLIYSEWYRDQNLIDTPDSSKIVDDGPDDQDVAGEQHFLQKRGKRHDYFTQALPWPQKGTAVDLPLGTTAPLKGLYISQATNFTGSADQYELDGSSTAYTTNDVSDQNVNIATDFNSVYADLTNATAATINDIREAFQIQKLLERDARNGTRYNEVIKNHFGVDFYDVSYRPEFLGGGSTQINVNPVVQTGGGTIVNKGAGAIGELSAYSNVTATDHGFNKTFVEHGIVMGIVSVRADLTYQYGLNRFFSHATRYDKYWPSLAHLGEQAILNKEIYCQGAAADDNVFGYVPRYDEYRHNLSRITGIFQSTATGSLDAWHLSEEYASLPTLGQTWIEASPPLSRNQAVVNEPEFIFDSYFNVRAARPIPTFGTPGLMDHF